MKIFLLTLIICLLFTASGKAAALDVATKKILDEHFSAMIGDSGTKVLGLGVVVFKDGREIYSYFGGRRHVNPDKPVKKNTLFRSASVSKMFTIFAVMKLVEQGKINLDDDASKYLGFKLRNPNFPDMPITVKMLANHTSSLRDGKGYLLPPEYSLKEFFTAGGVAYEDGAHFAPTPNKAPGKFFSYCNLNFCVLGTIVERVTGERFDRYQWENIFKPLEIRGGYVVGNFSDATFQELGATYSKSDGKNYDEFGAWHAQIDDYKVQPRRDTVRLSSIRYGKISYNLNRYEIGTNATIFEPQGGLRLSFQDLSNCLEMLMNRGKFKGRQILSEQSVDTILASHWIYDEKNYNGNTLGGVMENYGLATYKLGGESKARPCRDLAIDLIGHSGEACGLISGLYFVPGTRDGFVFMINGVAIRTFEDKRSFGQYSAGFIWEEAVMNPVCKYIFAE